MMFNIKKELCKFTIHLIIILLLSIIACRKSVDVVTELPPANALLGHTWTRPTDNMVMTYVPAGKFDMGTDEDGFYVALELCHQYFDGHSVYIPDLDVDDTIVNMEEWNFSEENDISQGDILGTIRTSEQEKINIVSDYNGQFVRLVNSGQEVSVSEPIAIIGDKCDFEWFQDESLFTDDVGRVGFAVQLDGFWIDKTEVTNAQYMNCVTAGVCEPPVDSASDTRNSYYGDSDYDNYPVINIPWDQAKTYCEWTGAALPTEAQWEYASRGSEGRLFPWGDTFDGTLLNYCDVNCRGVWADESVDDGYADTASVASFPEGASWCGALNMAGNVWEWVADLYMPYHMFEGIDPDYFSSPLKNPTGASYGDFGSGSFRIFKGGAAISRPDDARGAGRNTIRPGFIDGMIGFRCAMGE